MLYEVITASPYFLVHISRDERILEAELMAGELRGLVVIPEDFSRLVAKGSGSAVLQVVADGSESYNFV